MKRRNHKKLTIDHSTIRELKHSDFERSNGAALSISPIFSPISPIRVIAPDDPIDC
jgi:hypothetical protein